MTDLAEALILTDGHDLLRAMPTGPHDAFGALLMAQGLRAREYEALMPGFGVLWLRCMADSLRNLSEQLPGLVGREGA